MNKTIRKYLNDNFPEKNLNSIYGKYNIRFELGGEILKNGTAERVSQVVKRANEIYKQAIGLDEVIIAIEEYENDFYDINQSYKPYLSEGVRQISY